MHSVSERFDFTGDELAPAYRAAVDAIEAGDLVVLPTDTVYGIAADAFKADAVQRLLDAKGRGRDMPPPVLISVVESLDALATDIPDAGRKLCEAFWPGPLTVICHAQGSLMWDLGDTQGTVALRVPDHENTRELLSRTGPLAVSSANLSGQPAALDVYDAEAQLLDTVAVYLDGGITTAGEPSTIVDLTGEVPHVVRLGALSLQRLQEVVPETTTDLTSPPDETAEVKPADEPTADDGPDGEPTADAKPSNVSPVDGGPPEEAAEPKPADEPAAEPEPTESQPSASHQQEAGDKAGEQDVVRDKAADVRPAD
ncbi:L-threonylcarbamoyladenylate synthase [Kribbella catacumbae]|uniref:L-threonylcarbamoyladenylate synthase n=1 Tax=Kribbella catacumbae TaxID=460086 RepID=UPI00037CFCA7|nr:L-threonylcarbamoyladenylate synthase [Kribbella catacumbae]